MKKIFAFSTKNFIVALMIMFYLVSSSNASQRLAVRTFENRTEDNDVPALAIFGYDDHGAKQNRRV